MQSTNQSAQYITKYFHYPQGKLCTYLANLPVKINITPLKPMVFHQSVPGESLGPFFSPHFLQISIILLRALQLCATIFLKEY